MNHTHSHRARLALIGMILVTAMLLGLVQSPGHVTQAQTGGTLGYGAKVYGTVSADTPLIAYSFSGSPGDFVVVNADSWAGALDIQLDLVAPNGLVLNSSSQNMPGGDPMGAYMSVVLPDAGIYLLRVSGAGGTTGDFLLMLSGRSAAASTPLVYGQAVDVTVPQNAPSQYYSFEVEDCATTLVITNQSPGQPFTFSFVVKVRDQRGQDVALLRGGEQAEDWITIAPHSGWYEVEVSAADPVLAGMIRLLVTCSFDNPGCSAGVPGMAGLPGLAECRPCPGFDELVPGGGCPDLNLRVQQNLRVADGTTVFWDSMPGAEGYSVTVYGLTPTGEVYLTRGEWHPGDPTEFTWILPVEGYLGYRFVLEVLVEGGVICTQTVSIDIERTEFGCPDLGLTGVIVDADVNSVLLNWAAGLGADQFDLALYSLMEGGEVFSGVVILSGDATSFLFGHFPPELNGARLVLWMMRGDMLCSDEITILFGDEQVVCPDLGLSVTGHDPAAHILTLAWFGLEEIAGYELDIYGTDAGGIETLIEHVIGIPAGVTTDYNFLYPDGYVGFRFVLRIVGGPIECSDELVVWPQNQPEGGPCAIITDRGDIWMHVGPGRERGVFDLLPPDQDILVVGFATDGEGNTWWEIDRSMIPGGMAATSLWVMASDVAEVGDCSEVPPGDVPPVVPEGDPDRPPGTWGPCGSCDTCGHPAGECVTSPAGECLWDPATCAPGGGPCYTVTAAIDMGQCFGSGSAMIDIAPNCEGGQYMPGTTIQAHAIAVDQKCVVQYWSGCGVSGGGTNISFVPPGSCTVTAHMGY